MTHYMIRAEGNQAYFRKGFHGEKQFFGEIEIKSMFEKFVGEAEAFLNGRPYDGDYPQEPDCTIGHFLNTRFFHPSMK